MELASTPTKPLRTSLASPLGSWWLSSSCLPTVSFHFSLLSLPTSSSLRSFWQLFSALVSTIYKTELEIKQGKRKHAEGGSMEELDNTGH